MKEVYDAQAEATKAAEPARMLFDLVCAQRRGETSTVEMVVDEAAIAGHPGLANAEERSAELAALHLPIAFPEVFLRENPGFDCILGNPPWEKLHVESHAFWALRYPGLRGLRVEQQAQRITQFERERPDLANELEAEILKADAARATLLSGPFPGLGRGHPDLFKAFAWRFWALLREHGALGCVMPRSLVAASGGTDWRETVLRDGTFLDVTSLLNRAAWVFEDVDPRYTVVLLSIQKQPGLTLRFAGPFRAEPELTNVSSEARVEVAASEFAGWSPSKAFPLLPSVRSSETFLRLRAHPGVGEQVGEFLFRPVQGDLNGSTFRDVLNVGQTRASHYWPVYNGASFDLWQPDRGDDYGQADPGVVRPLLAERRLRQGRTSTSAFSLLPPAALMDETTLPCLHPRIAFRDVTRATDTRTVRVALVPPFRVLTHKAPWLLRVRGNVPHEAFLLGVLSSHPLDWYARRFVELGLPFDLLNGFPVPRLDAADSLFQRLVELVAGIYLRLDPVFEDWAKAATEGRQPADVEFAEAQDRVDAVAAAAFGLERKDVVHVFETFHEGWDPRERLDRVLAYYESL